MVVLVSCLWSYSFLTTILSNLINILSISFCVTLTSRCNSYVFLMCPPSESSNLFHNDDQIIVPTCTVYCKVYYRNCKKSSNRTKEKVVVAGVAFRNRDVQNTGLDLKWRHQIVSIYTVRYMFLVVHVMRSYLHYLYHSWVICTIFILQC